MNETREAELLRALRTVRSEEELLGFVAQMAFAKEVASGGLVVEIRKMETAFLAKHKRRK